MSSAMQTSGAQVLGHDHSPDRDLGFERKGPGLMTAPRAVSTSGLGMLRHDQTPDLGFKCAITGGRRQFALQHEHCNANKRRWGAWAPPQTQALDLPGLKAG